VNEHDELTDTGVIRFQRADELATARFISHFLRDLKTEDSPDLLPQQVAA